MESLKIGNDHLVYKIMSGKVLKVESRTETKINGGGGSGSTLNGTGVNSSVYISSETFHHQTVYLKDTDGKEFSVVLENFNISAIDGQELAIIWVESLFGKGVASVHNLTMNTTYNGRLRMFFRPIAADDGSAIIKLGALAAIGVPALFYSMTKSEVVGGVTFILTAIGVGIMYRKWQKRRDSGDKGAMKLRSKVVEIIEGFRRKKEGSSNFVTM